jgi:hypothetical protein
MERAAWVNWSASKHATICPPIQIFNLDMYYTKNKLLFAVRIQYLLLSATGIWRNLPCCIDFRASRIDVSHVAQPGHALMTFANNKEYLINYWKKNEEENHYRLKSGCFSFFRLPFLRESPLGTDYVPPPAKPNPWNCRIAVILKWNTYHNVSYSVS